MKRFIGLRLASCLLALWQRLLELKNNFLLPINYHAKVIDSQFKRVKNLPGENYSEKRKNALKKKEIKENENKGRVIAPLDFNPSLPNLSEIFAKHFKAMIQGNQVELK